MNYVGLGQALQWIGPLVGTDDRPNLIEAVDYMRDLMYTIFAEIPLAVDRQECVELERFPLSCVECQDDYLGFTLPYDAEAVCGITRNERPLSLRASWEDIRRVCGCDVAAYNVLERAFYQHEPCGPGRIAFLAKNRADEGKKVFLRYLDRADGPEKEETLLLRYEEWVPSVGTVIETRHLAFEPHAGEIVARSEPGGRILSRYQASETQPLYKRVRLEGFSCSCGEQLYVTYARKRIKVLEDHELVEVDSPVLWNALARYYRTNQQADPGREALAAAGVALASARAVLTGEHRRQTAATAPILRFPTGGMQRSLLAKKR